MAITLDSSKNGEKCLDSQLWHACAGGMVQMHKVNTKVYYFPQGHAEHACNPVDFPPTVPPYLLCRVTAVKFLADPETDEVFARIRLDPIKNEGYEDDCEGFADSNGMDCAEKPSSFAKTLTQSDANNGGGFSVPRYCAETIFPRLDYSMDPPVQTVLAKDVHGTIWKFRHIYRGTPRRHLLTTGWSTFVNQKKLVAGDSIVFLRSANGELCVGVRRSSRGIGGESSAWCPAGFSVFLREDENKLMKSANGGGYGGNGNGGVWRNRGKVSAKEVLEAASLAAAGRSFEVVYYPRVSTPEFCVRSSSVNCAMRVQWSTGMRFKMAFETEDSSRISWFMGTISGVQVADPVNWPNSPWRVLQVSWDEPDLLQNVKRVNPWLVEVVSNIPTLQISPFSLPKKKHRISHPDFSSLDGTHCSLVGPTPTLPPNLLGLVNPPWQQHVDSVPSAGIQGARHGRFGISLPNLCPNSSTNANNDIKPHHLQQQGVVLFPDGFWGGAPPPPPVSTELNIGNGSLSSIDRSSIFNEVPASLLTNNSPNRFKRSITTVTMNENNSSSPSKGSVSGTHFMLFGKSICMDQQQASGLSSTTDNGSPVRTSNSSSNGNPESFTVAGSVAKAEGPNFCDNFGLRLSSGMVPPVFGAPQGLFWCKDQMTKLSLEKGGGCENGFDDGMGHCKVFMESEDVGRTLDLSLFGSYEELYKKLAAMFMVEEREMEGRVLYRDANGAVRHTGDEPYSNFMKTARRLTILSDSGSDNMGR
ncbi:auxin response factor 18 [Amborella trichopoda]|nr:auxin response factor 18 [Amborella trichopoda]|eukprot:XP_011624034.1 auxin response factor 18 [Amborella trichopoda]